MAFYALRYGSWPLPPLYQEFAAFDRAPGTAREKMYLSRLGRPFGVAGKQTLSALAHPEQSSDPILGPLDGAALQIHGPRPGLRDRQIDSGSLAESHMRRVDNRR